MLFEDNFIHGDLHPGNMFFNVGNGYAKSKKGVGGGQPELIYLDCGLAIQMSPRDSENF